MCCARSSRPASWASSARPRHIIRAIVEMVDPKVGETVYDPAAGTAGFLVAAYNHIRLANSSPTGIQAVEFDGKTQRAAGRPLSANRRAGEAPEPRPSSATTWTRRWSARHDEPHAARPAQCAHPAPQRADHHARPSAKAELGLPTEGYDVMLANPPFSGRVDKDRIVDDVKIGTSTATELLFLKYMMDSLRPGGRCGVIVPEGVLFGSTGAHKELRRQLIENNRVEAVLSLPGGVFQPYSGVKTSVLFFTKGGTTENVMFLHADADGYKLDANHDTPIEADDLPGLAAAYRAARRACWPNGRRATQGPNGPRNGGSPIPPPARQRLQPLRRALPAYEPGAGAHRTRASCWTSWRRSRPRSRGSGSVEGGAGGAHQVGKTASA
jgi:type I restriction enzyme M protein